MQGGLKWLRRLTSASPDPGGTWSTLRNGSPAAARSWCSTPPTPCRLVQTRPGRSTPPGPPRCLPGPARTGAPPSPCRPTDRCAASRRDRKSTRLNSSHLGISYAVFCLKTKQHTSELQSLRQLVCRLVLDTKQRRPISAPPPHRQPPRQTSARLRDADRPRPAPRTVEIL